jgi:putative ABC transport system permease protein
MKIAYYLKWSLKQFRKYPLQTAINVLGLAVGVTVFSFIMIFVNHQISVDQFHEKVDRIYRIENGFGGITPATYSPALKDKIPEVSAVGRFRTYGDILQYTPENYNGVKQGIRVSVGYLDESIFDIFSYSLLRGDIADLYNMEGAIFLSESLAHKLFGEEDPLHKIIHSEDGERYVVKGIMADLPETTSISFSAMVAFEHLKVKFHDPNLFDSWGRWMYETYVLSAPDASSNVVKEKIDGVLEEASANKGVYNVQLKPYGDIYLTQVMDFHRHGNQKHVLIFSLVGIFVILIALINYVNINTALAATRFKALGIKKIVGAKRADLVRLILFESIVVAFISVVLALLLIEFFTPMFQDFTNIEATLPYSFGFLPVAFIVVPLLLGSLAGFFPAVYLSDFKLLDVLKGKTESGRAANRFRSILTVVQFVIAVFLITGTLLVQKQLRFVNQFDPGYTIEQVGYLFAPNEISNNYDSFKQQLLNQSGVKAVSRCNNVIVNSGNFATVEKEERKREVYYYAVDEDFTDLFGVELLKGRLFRASDMQKDDRPVLITRELAHWYGGIDSALTQEVLDHKVIGVVENMQTQNLHQKSNPVVMHLTPAGRQSSLVYIKMDARNYKETLTKIEDVCHDFVPALPFEFHFLQDSFEDIYRADIRFGQVFLIFSIVAICLACLGLFALISFVSLKRTKEIGVRKSLGSSTLSIVWMLSVDFGKWVLLANLIALPAAYFFLSSWLASFEYSTTLSWWIFGAAAFISLLIALATIFYHTLRIARQNPVVALRVE